MSNVRKKYSFSNKRLAEHAKFATTNGSFERKKGYCLRWVRQVVENLQGKSWTVPRGLDAWEAGKELERQGFAVPLTAGSKAGDLLFKAPSKAVPQGHVGIRIYGNAVAENSSYHAKTYHDDARGTRSIADFGRVALIIRLGKDED